MPATTHATAVSTSAIPTVMPITTALSINPPVTPIPLPQRQSPTAPRFDPKNPSTLCTYISDYELLAKAAQLTPAEQLAQSTHCNTLKHSLQRRVVENWPVFERSLLLRRFLGS